jgi:hypothetical protein
MRRLRADRGPLVRTGPASQFKLASAEPVALAPDVILPSSVALGASEAVEVMIPDTLGFKVALKGHVTAMDRLGDAIHEFLAGDGDRSMDARIALAQRLVDGHEVAGAVDPSDVPKVADALTAWVEGRFGARGTWLREWPVRWLVPTDPRRLLIGEIDLAIELPGGFVIIDHKSFPGDADARDARAKAYAGQLAAYAAAMHAATGKPVLGTFIHFPVRGEVQEVRIPDGAFARWLGVPIAVPAVTPVAPVVAPPVEPVRTVVPRRAPKKRVDEEPDEPTAQLSLFPRGG